MSDENCTEQLTNDDDDDGRIEISKGYIVAALPIPRMSF